MLAESLLNIFPVAVTGVHDRDLGQPTLDPAFRACGNKHQCVIRHPSWLDVVKRSARQLPQSGSIRLDFVKMVVIRSSGPIREDDRLSVVVHDGIANSTLWIIQQHRDFSRADVDFGQTSQEAIGLALTAIGVIAKIRIPVSVVVERTFGEDNLSKLFGGG